MRAVSYRVRSWVGQRWRTVVVLALLVALAGGGALTLLAGARRTITAPDRYSNSRGALYDVSFQQQQGRPRNAELEALPAITTLETATFVFGSLTTAGGDELVDSLVFAGTQGPLGTRLVEGRLPEPTQPNEFVATKSFVARSGSAIGDQFDVATLTQDQADAAGFDAPDPAGPRITATLVGVIDGPADLEDGYAVALFPATLLDLGEIGVSATVGVASLADGATVDDLRGELDALADGAAFSLDRAEWVSSDIRAAVNAQGQGLVLLGAIVLVATIVVLGQMLTRQLRLADDEREVLLSVGLSPRHLVAEPVVRTTIAVVAGMVGAVAIAYAFSGVFPLSFVGRVEPNPGRHLDALIVPLGALALAVALVLWVAVAMLLDARRTSPSRSPGTAEKLAEASPNAGLSTALRFAFTPTAQGSRSGLAPLFGLTLVFCLLFGALTFGTNLLRLVDEPTLYGENYDLALGSGATEISADILSALNASPDVGALTLYGTTTAAVGSTSLDVVGMQPVRGGLAPQVRAGRLPQGEDEVALASQSAEGLGVAPGDEIVVTGASGERSLTVTGLAMIPPVGGADSLGHGALVSAAGLAALDPEAGMNAVAVRVAPSAATGAVARIAAVAGMESGNSDPPSAILNLRRVRTIPFLVALSVGLLALLSLGHLMIVAVRRRRRDLAILRVFGATPRWLSGVVHWQATIITGVVLAIAIPVGTLAGRALYRAFIEPTGALVDDVVPIAWLVASLGALIILANLVAALPARRTAREAPAVVLATE